MRRWEWQAPPGWPKPPPGWSPWPGWRPDPAWPEPPKRWRWWRRAPRTRWQRVRLGLLIGSPALALVVFFGALMAAQAADDRAGCGSVDPTDPENYSIVHIVNDTARPVVIDHCVSAECQIGRLPHRLAPGRRYTDDAACGVSDVDMTSWRVRTPDGTVLGYIAVNTPRKHDGLDFDVSHASRNRYTPTPAVR